MLWDRYKKMDRSHSTSVSPRLSRPVTLTWQSIVKLSSIHPALATAHYCGELSDPPSIRPSPLVHEVSSGRGLCLPQKQNKALKLLLAISLSSQATVRWFSVQFSSPLSEDFLNLLRLIFCPKQGFNFFYGAQLLQSGMHNIKILSNGDKQIISMLC